ncbi:hypothetical protein [Candidatus Magnetobacterium casense]|uniref:Uncharacterized protein n=1 Tax=Candidatus Magnetobacterium casense TaxID=1455061 RepID=A0ABS6RX68_9BACT|nr:hypothetical protein [Candidatus Magnetobacterium casensis]MBV6341220.1 hypothetical protein [Candidatus Magnetobacterium casensis]
MTKLLRLLAVLGVLGLALAPLVAHADLTPPDTTELEDARIWKHMLEPDDVLMVVRYNAHYGNMTDQPYQPITDTFYFTYGNSTGTILGNETAYPFFNLGYVKGLVAFYWDADDPLKPAWGDLGNVTMQGTALYGGSPPSDVLTLTADDWNSATQPSSLREDLRQWLLNALIFLELDWNNWAVDQGYTDRQVTLTVVGDGYGYASPQGEAYLGLTIDGITDMVPLLFLTQTGQPTHTDEEWTLAQQNIFEQLHAGDVVGNATETLGTLMGGISGIWAVTMVVMAGCLGIIIVCTAFWGRLNNGLLIAYTVILIATPEGLFQMGLMALFAMIAVLYLADIFLSKRQA